MMLRGLWTELEHVQFFSRSMIAGDMLTNHALDVNTAFVSLAGTSKHVMVSASHPAHVSDIAQICYAIAGSEQAFREKAVPVPQYQPRCTATAL